MDPTISFVKVQQYLDKAESAALISFAYEIEDLAKKEGLSPKEEDAVEMYIKNCYCSLSSQELYKFRQS